MERCFVIRYLFGILMAGLLLFVVQARGAVEEEQARLEVQQAREDFEAAYAKAQKAYEELKQTKGTELFQSMEEAIDYAQVEAGQELMEFAAKEFSRDLYGSQSVTFLGFLGACKTYYDIGQWLGKDAVLVTRNVRTNWIVLTELWPAKRRYEESLTRLNEARGIDPVQSDEAFFIEYPSTETANWDGVVSGHGAIKGQVIKVFIKTNMEYLQGKAEVSHDGTWRLMTTWPTLGTVNVVYAKMFDQSGNQTAVTPFVEIVVRRERVHSEGYGGTIYMKNGDVFSFLAIGNLDRNGEIKLDDMYIHGTIGGVTNAYPFEDFVEISIVTKQGTRIATVVKRNTGDRFELTTARICRSKTNIKNTWLSYVCHEPIHGQLVEQQVKWYEISRIEMNH
jgi:hypothetical protein